MSTVEQLLRDAAADLSAVSPSPRLDAELLAAHIFGMTRIGLISAAKDPVPRRLISPFLDLIRRRKLNEPVAYLTGSREFWGLDFEVAPAVLVPRPETELLVERALEHALALGAPRILDLGTGSGCIAVSVASELRSNPDARVVALDRSPEALEIAKLNAARHGVADRIELLASDWFSALESGDPSFDLIVSNPPYIAEGDMAVSPETAYEPASALYSGETGLDDIERIMRRAPKFLRPGGWLLFEHGASQRARIESLFGLLRSSYTSLEIVKDLAGLDRVAELRTPLSPSAAS